MSSGVARLLSSAGSCECAGTGACVRAHASETMGSGRLRTGSKETKAQHFPDAHSVQDEERYVAKHHPFTSPWSEDIEMMTSLDKKDGGALARGARIRRQAGSGGW